MTFRGVVLLVAILAVSVAQSGSKIIVANLDSAAFHHDQGDAPDSESVLLREDPKTGGMDLLARYPASHLFVPHWHECNERIIVLEGQLTVSQDTGATALNPGGFAFLPAREVQRLSCTSKTRCTFYLAWDGNAKSHPAK